MADYGMEAMVPRTELRRRQSGPPRRRCRRHAGPAAFRRRRYRPHHQDASVALDPNNPAFREMTLDQFVHAYYEQVAALVEGGVDLLLVETIFDTQVAKAALVRHPEVLRRGRARGAHHGIAEFADTAGAPCPARRSRRFWNSISHADLLSCRPELLARPEGDAALHGGTVAIAPAFVSAYPNAGLPDPLLPTGFPETPESMAPPHR